MNRGIIGFGARLRSPRQPYIDYSDYYKRRQEDALGNTAIQKIIDTDADNEVKESIENRKKAYEENKWDFRNFADAVDPSKDEFFTPFWEKNKPTDNEIVITPDGAKTQKEYNKEQSDKMRMLKNKKWISGISGNKDSFTDKDAIELKELEDWHNTIYPTDWINDYKQYEYKPNTIDEAIDDMYRKALEENANNRPKGYWMNTLLALFGNRPGVDYNDTADILFTGRQHQDYKTVMQQPNFTSDVAFTFANRANDVQIDDSKGKIKRGQELQFLANSGLEDLRNYIKQVEDDKNTVYRLRLNMERNGGSLSNEDMSALKEAEDRLKQSAFNKNVATQKLYQLSGYNSGFESSAWEWLNDKLSKIRFGYDLGIRHKLGGLRQALDRVDNMLSKGYSPENEMKEVENILSEFNKHLSTKYEQWRSDIDTDQKDLERLNRTYQPTAWFDANDQLSQDLGLFSPKKMFFSTAGLLGSSTSSAPKSMLKLASYAMALGGGGWLAGAAATNLFSGGAQAADENNAEVGNAITKEDFISRIGEKSTLAAKMLEDGRKQLKNDNADLEDIVDAFTEGRIFFEDVSVQRGLLNVIAGANQHWAKDMNATAPGVWIDAAITVVPDHIFAQALKYTKAIPGKLGGNTLREIRELAKAGRIEGLIGKDGMPVEEVLALTSAATEAGAKSVRFLPNIKRSIKNGIEHVASEEAIASARKTLNYVSQLGKKIPNRILENPKSAAIWKGTKSFGRRFITGTGSEFWEEDVQSIRQHEAANGEYSSDFESGIYNPALIFDNIIDGVRSSWDFLFKDPSKVTQEEREIWKEAKLGALGWLAQGGIAAFAQSANGSWKQINATDAALSNIRATKAEDDARIQKGALYSKYAKRASDYDTMMAAFDAIENANRRKNKHAEQTGNTEDAGFAQEDIEENRKLYQEIYNLKRNPIVRMSLKANDISEEDEDDYISIVAQKMNVSETADKRLREIVNAINATIGYNERGFIDWLAAEHKDVYDLYSKYYKKDTDEEVDPLSSVRVRNKKGQMVSPKQRFEEEFGELQREYLINQNADAAFADLAAWLEIYETYKDVEDFVGNKSEIARRAKEYIDTANRANKKAGIKEYHTREEVDNDATDIDKHKNYVEMYVKKHMYELDAQVANETLNNLLFGVNSKKNGKDEIIYTGKTAVKQYREANESDKALQQRIETDFFNTIKRRREVSDWIHEHPIDSTNDIYTGYDGKLYVAEKVRDDDNGNPIYAKRELDKDSLLSTGEDKPFDAEEYYEYNQMVESDYAAETSDEYTSDQKREFIDRRKEREKRQKDRDNAILANQIEDAMLSGNISAVQDMFRQLYAAKRLEESSLAAENRELEELGSDQTDDVTQDDVAEENAIKDEYLEGFSKEERDRVSKNLTEPKVSRVFTLLKDGYTAEKKHTKRGKTIYQFRKGSSKEIVSKDEYDFATYLSIRDEYAEAIENAGNYRGNEPLLSINNPSSYSKSTSLKQAVETEILNAIYSQNLPEFERLMSIYSNVLNSEQIKKFYDIYNLFNDSDQSPTETSSTELVLPDRKNKRFERFFEIKKAIDSALSGIWSILVPAQIQDLVELEQDAVKAAEAYANTIKNKMASKNAYKHLTDRTKGPSLAAQIMFMNNAGFVFKNENGKYIAVSNTGDVFKITKTQYDFVQSLQKKPYVKPITEVFKPIQDGIDGLTQIFGSLQDASVAYEMDRIAAGVTPQRLALELKLGGITFDTQEQEETYNRLIEKVNEDKKNVLGHTSHDYFIKVNGKVTIFPRVHSWMPKMFENARTNARKDYTNRLIDTLESQRETLSVEEYKKVVNDLQEEVNTFIAAHYGTDSDIYKRNAIDLSLYLLDDVINTKESIIGIANTASIVYKDAVGKNPRFDVIARSVIAGSIIDQIARDFFSGKTVEYDENTFKMPKEAFDNLLAGMQEQKDMFDRLGWKLITDELTWNQQLPDGSRIAGVTDMIAVDRSGNVHILDFKTHKRGTHARARLPKDFKSDDIKSEFQEQYSNGKSPYNEYVRQLTAYQAMIELDGYHVASKIIVPYWVRTSAGINEVTGKHSPEILGRFIADNEPSHENGYRSNARYAIAQPPFYIGEPSNARIVDELNRLSNRLNNGINVVKNYLESNKEKLGQSFDVLGKRLFDNITSRLTGSWSMSTTSELFGAGNIIWANEFVRDMQTLLTELEDIYRQASGIISAYDEATSRTAANRFAAAQRAATGRIEMFSNIDMTDAAIIKYRANGVDIDLWNKLSTEPEFVNSAVFKLNIKQYKRNTGSIGTPRGISIDVEYKGHTFRGLLLNIATQDENGNQINPRDTELIKSIDKLLYIDKVSDDTVIVLKGVSRTNGVADYSGKLESAVTKFGLRQDEINTLLDGNEVGEIGIVDKGSVRKSRPNVNVDPSGVHFIEPGREMRDGIVVLEYKLGYNEDPNQSFPIALTPANFEDSDIDFIIRVLQRVNRKETVLDEKGNSHASPITYSDLLRMLVRFGEGASITGNTFQFHYLRLGPEQNNFDYNTVVLSGVGNMPGEHRFNLKNAEDVENLKKILKENLSVYYNNESLFWRGTSRDIDNDPNNPFFKLEEFFKNNPSVNEISYSEHLTFNRKDVDPDGDGSFKGIRGFAWMMNHGFFQSTYNGIKNPLISFERAEIQTEPEVKAEVKEEKRVQLTAQQQGEVSVINVDDDVYFGYDEESNPYFDEDSAGLPKTQRSVAEVPLDREQALKRLRQILPKDFPIAFTSKIIQLTENGHIVVGKTLANGIIMSDAAENGVEFHEAFHAIVELLIPKHRREELYKHYREKYAAGEKMSDREVAEALADMYYDFRNGIEGVEFTWNLIKYFKRIRQFNKALKSLDDATMAKIFRETTKGKFRKISMDSSISEDFLNRFGKEGLNYEIIPEQGKSPVNLDNFANRKEVDDAVKVITYYMITKSGVDLLGSSIDKLRTDLQSVRSIILGTPEEKKKAIDDIKNKRTPQNSSFYDKLIAKGKDVEQLFKDGKINALQRANILKFREMFSKWDECFLPLVEREIESYGVDKKLVRKRNNKEDKDGNGTSIAEDIEGHDDEFWTHSMRDDVAVQIKFFLSTRPNLRFATQDDVDAGVVGSLYRTVNGKQKRVIIPNETNSMGLNTFASYEKIYNMLLQTLHESRDFDDFESRLDKLAENDFIFSNIRSNFHRFRYLSYRRHNNDEYTGIPIVMYKGTVLNPSEYIADVKHPTKEELFPNLVRYSHDVVDANNKIVHRKGEIIDGAVIMTNPDYESYASKMYLAVKAQKLDFQFTFVEPKLDDLGRPVGKYSYNEGSTNTESASETYPRLWFDNIRTAYFGILDQDDYGDPVFSTGEKTKVFGETAKNLRYLNNVLKFNTGKINMHSISLPGIEKQLDVDNTEDLHQIISFVAKQLQNVGIDIDTNVLKYTLRQKYPNSTTKDAFIHWMINSGKTSISPFIDTLELLNTAVEQKDVELFTVDRRGDEKRSLRTSGSDLYYSRGFVTDLGTWYGRYKSAYEEGSIIGPGGNKMYTFAEHHQASETLEDLNNTYDEKGNLRDNSTVADLMQSQYVLSADRRHGSIVMKTLLDPKFNPTHDKLTLSTSSGVKLGISNNLGQKYSEISSRDDILSKMAILQEGHIIFPTLSDKSTWFFLKGIVLPGFNYNSSEIGHLPMFGKNGKIAFTSEELKSQNSIADDAVLDQLIEYAYRELEMVNQTIIDLDIQPINTCNNDKVRQNDKIKNFHDNFMNGARFCFISGVYGKLNDDGTLDESVDEYIPFNYYDEKDPVKSVLDSRSQAMALFFDKRPNETDQQLRMRQRSMVMNILKHRLSEELDNLVEKGIITRVPVGEGINPYVAYTNKFLDDSKIKQLARAYSDHRITDKLTIGQLYKNNEKVMESFAICAYVYDCMVKSIMSKEETQRIFTGFPHFFKWKFDANGYLSNITEDESKRLGGQGSTGTQNIEGLANIPESYRCAEIDDYEIASPMYKVLRKMFEDAEYREALANYKLLQKGRSQTDEEIYSEVYSMNLDDVKEAIPKDGNLIEIIEEKIESESNSYAKEINVADGTAFITDKMAENLLRMRGAYEGNVKKAFDLLRSGTANKYNNAANYKIIVDALISTQKYSAFGYRMQNKLPVHYYHKFALFPIFKDIAYGFTGDLYEKMTDPSYGVDMVLFSSAVKVGAQASQRFDPDMDVQSIKDFSFKDHTYLCKYKNIRRQLNTDPHESEVGSMGTQAAKVAMSVIRLGQTYKVGDSSYTGRQIRDNMMTIIKKLSEIGKERFENTIFDKSGENVDIHKLCSFLRDQLKDRDADKNILDAIDEFEKNPGDKGILNTVSNLSWIESVLASQINKDVIDINLYGNAFYQRSVFGMTRQTVLYDNKFVLNNNTKLNLVNSDGSMDAVISIDFFYPILKGIKDSKGEDIRFNFEEARQWLINHKIIGKDADTTTIGYRIPTQAVSSIHALKFVDVVHSIRDTIILPEEFTKVTGSDFDIDKLYLSMYSYNKNGTREFKEGSEDYLKNNLLDYYFALLKDSGTEVNGRYIHMLHRSIDNDTSLITKILKEHIEKDIIRTPYEPMASETLSYQSSVKNAFITGKQGIAPFALNNNNQILTTLYEVEFGDMPFGIMSQLYRKSLHDQLDRDGNSIMSWLSALINAHVDVAKDPYILRLNVNQYTYNLVNLLVRTGFGDDAFYFTAQPILKHVADVYNSENGSIKDDPLDTSSQAWENKEKEVVTAIQFGTQGSYDDITSKLKRLYNFGNNGYSTQDMVEDAAVFRELFGISASGEYNNSFTTADGTIVEGKTILQDIMENKNVLIDKTKPLSMDNLVQTGMYKIGNRTYSPRELQAYIFIAKKQFDIYANSLSALVHSTKIDTKKHGISYIEQNEYLKKYSALYSKTVNGQNKMFNSNLINMLYDSYIDQKTNDAIEILPKILKGFVVTSTDNFIHIVDRIASETKNFNVEAKQRISSALLIYIKQKCMNTCMSNAGVSATSLITGGKSIAARLAYIKNKINNSDEFIEYRGNYLLENLNRIPYSASFGQQRYGVVALTNTNDDSSSIQNMYIDAWNQLYKSGDTEISTFARDLAFYAFITSGDTRGFSKFFKYVPLDIRKDIGYVDEMNRMFDAFNSGKVQLSEFDTGDNMISLDEFLRNNWQNNDLVPVIQKYRKNRAPLIRHDVLYKDVNAATGNEVLRVEPQIFADPSIKVNTITGKFPQYVKIKRSYSTRNDADPYILYRYIGNGEFKNGTSTITYPIYAMTYPKGLRVRAGSNNIEFYEYERNDMHTHIINRNATMDVDFNDYVEDIVRRIKNFVDTYGMGKWRNEVLNSMFYDPYGLYDGALTGPRVKNNQDGTQSVSYVYDDSYLNILKALWRNYKTTRSSFAQAEDIYTGPQIANKPNVNSLPYHTGNSKTYAVFGNTVKEEDIKGLIKELGAQLEQQGYTMNLLGNTDTTKEFSNSTRSGKKKSYSSNPISTKLINIAKEINSNYTFLSDSKRSQIARSIAQMFDSKLNKPVDFVLLYTEDGIESSDNITQATDPTIASMILLAEMKGIPVINLANEEWSTKLEAARKLVHTPPTKIKTNVESKSRLRFNRIFITERESKYITESLAIEGLPGVSSDEYIEMKNIYENHEPFIKSPVDPDEAKFDVEIPYSQYKSLKTDTFEDYLRESDNSVYPDYDYKRKTAKMPRYMYQRLLFMKNNEKLCEILNKMELLDEFFESSSDEFIKIAADYGYGDGYLEDILVEEYKDFKEIWSYRDSRQLEFDFVKLLDSKFITDESVGFDYNDIFETSGIFNFKDVYEYSKVDENCR